MAVMEAGKITNKRRLVMQVLLPEDDRGLATSPAESDQHRCSQTLIPDMKWSKRVISLSISFTISCSGGKTRLALAYLFKPNGNQDVPRYESDTS